MRLRFQADGDLNESIVRGVLRLNLAIDFKTAPAAGRQSLRDFEVLTVAATEGRVLVSHHRKTMPRAFGEFVRAPRSPGLLRISQKN